jgi:NAD(P)-dependent dehydrogenase (short-subunit alcohol dehydrogenase family)
VAGPVVVDVADPESANAMAEAVVRAYGGIDPLVKGLAIKRLGTPQDHGRTQVRAACASACLAITTCWTWLVPS